MVYRFEREPLAGFVDSANPFQLEGIQMLNREGVIQNLPILQIKSLCFVREWLDGSPWSRSQYTVRPRQQGLWVRVQFRDGDILEATMPNTIAALDPVTLSIAPPDAASGVQRVLIPRIALDHFEVLGVVGSSLRRKLKAATNQLKMFD